jgi:amidohydrolase
VAGSAEGIYPRMVELRRTFHRYPELAFEEVKTARTIMDELDRLSIPYDYGGPGGGVVGRLIGTDPDGPAVALRADMDALPAQENTGLPFASEHPGKMHACGHDSHMAMVLGAASLLKADPPPGKVLLVFQPAEEHGGGARVVLRSGALAGVKAIFGAHVTHHHTVGEIMVKHGIVTAQSDVFKVRIRGSGGHGARPHEATDSVVIVGFMISALQTLVSRMANPLHPSVVTIGRVEAGTAANVIAGEGLLEGTIRTTWPEVRQQILSGFKRIVRGMAELHGAKIELELEEGYPPLVNTDRETEVAHRAALRVAGPENVVRDEHPSMGSEDFAYYLRQMPGAYVRIGARLPDEEPLALHSPSFTIAEEALMVGAEFFDAAAREAIAEYSKD